MGGQSIKMDLKEMGINTRNWVDSAKDRDYWRALVNTVLNLRVPKAMGFVSYVRSNVSVSFVHVRSCVVFGGSTCTLRTTGQKRPSNCVHAPLCVVSN